jgi:glycosyltransferase involved in cell wall biosynthesis
MPLEPPTTKADSTASSLSTNEVAAVTAIVPARNEEPVIKACVQSLAIQREISEILVINDQSTDKTAEIVRGLTSKIPQLRLLETRSVPMGWVGKNNAVWTGAQEAKNKWLLFTDADAELLPGAMARALELAKEKSVVLVSFSPEQQAESWYEKSLIPFIYCRLAKHFSFDAVNDPKSTVAAANGQFLMIRREAYAAIGGHAAIAGEVLEDVALAQRAKAAAHRIWFSSGKGIVRARMYRSFEAMWEGWKKNLYVLVAANRGSIFRELVSVVPWIPLLLVLVGVKMPLALVAGLGLLMARHASYGRELTSNQYRPSYILYYVPGALLYAGVLLASFRAYRRGTVEWKGRQVSVGISHALR